MKVLIIHNRYRERGGEDRVYELERDLLEQAGITVEGLEWDNDDLREERLQDRVRVGFSTTWSLAGYSAVRRRLENFRPAIVHVHNTFPRLSPSIYYACRKEGVPVIQTLHNYRLLCASGTFLRDGHVCERCMRMKFYQGAINRCYRDSALASSAVVLMQYSHHLSGTYRSLVDRYIALTQFAKRKFIQGGLPAEKMSVKANTLSVVPSVGKGGDEVVYIGRLSPEKGIDVLLHAWSEKGLEYPLRVIGDGPLRGKVEKASSMSKYIHYQGPLPSDDCQSTLMQSAVMVIPSIWYEGFPMTVLESYAAGTPVIASDIGSLSELVVEDETGWRFDAGNSSMLAEKITAAMEDPGRLMGMRARCRDEFDRQYSPDKNVQQLISIYEDVVVRRRNRNL